jgi:hypothetical protein
MHRGDAQLHGGACEGALEAFSEARALLEAHGARRPANSRPSTEPRLSQEILDLELEAALRWRIFRARACVDGNLALPGPAGDPRAGAEAKRCEDFFPELGDEALMEDFREATKAIGGKRPKHLARWFSLLGISQGRCDARTVRKAYRERLRRVHPDKFRGPSECAHDMSLLINAAGQVIAENTDCGLPAA